MQRKLESLQDYINFAIHAEGGALIGIIVTSSASGKIPSLGLDYGAGKSTLLIDFLYDIYQNAEKVKQNMIYFPEEIFPILDRPSRTWAIGWDDMQLTVGKHKWADMNVKELAYMLTTQRPKVAILIGSTPHLGKLQKDFREFFHFEVKIPFRGYYEVQQVKYWTPFNKPLSVKSRLDYKGEAPFPKAPKELEEWYVEWRAEKNEVYRARLEKHWNKKKEAKLEPPPPVSAVSQAGRTLIEARWRKHNT